MTTNESIDQTKKPPQSCKIQSKTENATEIQETSAVNKITSLKLSHQY